MSITKLTIRGFELPTNNEIEKRFEADINPSKISISKTNNFSIDKAAGNHEKVKFDSVGTEQLNFELILDGTGLAGNTDVDAKLDLLESIIYSYQGNTHSPNYVHINWKTDSFFKGIVTNFNVEYNLFRSDGSTLRAKVSLSIKSFYQNRDFNSDQSPDITHVAIIKSTDTLFQLANEIYGDPKYSIEVAKANNLVNFRYIPPGTRIIFPPLRNF